MKINTESLRQRSTALEQISPLLFEALTGEHKSALIGVNEAGDINFDCAFEQSPTLMVRNLHKS